MQDNNIIIKHLKAHYYVTIVLLALLFVLIFFRVITFGDGEMIVSDGQQRWAIALTLAAIPMALWAFSEKMRKVTRLSKELKGENEHRKAAFVADVQRTYRTYFLLRLYLLSAGALLNIVLFGLTRNLEQLDGVDTLWFGISNYFWFSLLIFIVFVFCKPSEVELEKYTLLPDVETRHATSLQNDDDNIMWWEKGKEKNVPIDTVIAETAFDDSQNDEATRK